MAHSYSKGGMEITVESEEGRGIMYCRNCGSRIDDGSAACPVCGEVFSGAGDPGQHSGRKSGKKPREGKPLVLFICLGVLAAAALFVYFVL